MSPMAQTLSPLPANAAAPSRHQHNYPHLISSATAFRQLKEIHTQIIKHQENRYLFHLLLSSLSFPCSTAYALSLLSAVPQPPPNMSQKLIKHLSSSKNPRSTFLFFQTMQNREFPVDRYSFPPLLKAASKSMALSEGRMIHGLAWKMGFDCDPFVETALVGMYAASGRIADARLVFDNMSYRDVVTWNIMIDGYCQGGFFDSVIDLLEEMKCSDTEPDGRIYTTILSACSRARNLYVGEMVHGLLTERKLDIDSYLQSALINMYASCGAVDVAQSLYDKLKPVNVVASTALISGYSEVGNVEAARLIFDNMIEKDLVSWSAMISGYAESDSPRESLRIFHDMIESGIKPDSVTMLSVVSACAHLGAFDQARKIHRLVNDMGFGKALPVNNALIDMYAKCGNISAAKEVFDQMHTKNVISWTSMISAFAIHGDVDNAMKYFHQMEFENVEPNWVTFVGVLYACSHAGLVEEGRRVFKLMVNEYGITAKLEHYGCLVDLYGRANKLRDALELIESMPMAPNVVIWGSLMAACRIHGEFELGEFAAKRVLVLDPKHDGAHVFLSNLYAKEKRWGNVGEVRQFMKHKGITKERGCSIIEIDGEIHEFLTADKNHKQTTQIYNKLDEAFDKITRFGYIPNTSCVTIDLDEDEKEKVVLWHSEKLALCYGLIKVERDSCIRIIKNLRICQDCHNFMKLASEVFDKEIVVRDRTRFHHFKDGVCSCKDFW